MAEGSPHDDASGATSSTTSASPKPGVAAGNKDGRGRPSMKVHRVELGASLEDIAGRSRGERATPEARRRRQSPVERLRASVERRSSSRRPGRRASQQKPQHQQPQRQPQQRQPQQRQQQMAQGQRAPWTEVRNTVRRKSREQADKLRRRLSNAADVLVAERDRMRRASMSGTARDGNADQLERLRSEHRRRVRGSADPEMLMDYYPKDAGGAGNKEGSAPPQNGQRALRRGSQSFVVDAGRAGKKDGSVPPQNGQRVLRRGSQSFSIGSRRSSDLLAEDLDGGADVRPGLIRKRSLDSSMRDLDPSATKAPVPARRGTRRASLDSSMIHLKAGGRGNEAAPADADTPNRAASSPTGGMASDKRSSSPPTRSSAAPRDGRTRRRSHSDGNLDVSFVRAAPQRQTGQLQYSEERRASNRATRRCSFDASFIGKPINAEQRVDVSMIPRSGAASQVKRGSRRDSIEDFLQSIDALEDGEQKTKALLPAFVTGTRRATVSDIHPTRPPIDVPASGKVKRASIPKRAQGAEAAAAIAGRDDGSVDTYGCRRETSSSSIGSFQENGRENGRDRCGRGSKRNPRRLHIPPCILCGMVACYAISMALCISLGFGMHVLFTAYRPDPTNQASTKGADNTIGIDGSDSGNGAMAEGGEGTLNDAIGHVDINVDTFDVHVATAGSSSLPSVFPSQSLTTAPVILPTSLPSFMPSTSPPTETQSWAPSSQPTSTSKPTLSPSGMPSSSPTSAPGCPEELLQSAILDEEGLVTLKYEVVVPHPYGGGLLCASLEYTGGAASWIGLALSEARRNPEFGRKEAIVGIPGIMSSVAVDTSGSPSLGQQIAAVEEVQFSNPGKYEIPAGGLGGGGFSGPSLSMLSHIDKQTLVNGSVYTLDPNDFSGIVTAQSTTIHTKMTFVKYLQEPGEIAIDPHGSTLLVWAIASPSDANDYEWKSTYVTFMQSPRTSKISGPPRKRIRRQHHIN